MKYIFLLMVGLLVISITSLSQGNAKNLKKASISVGAQACVSAADLAETNSIGVGAHVLGMYGVSNKLSLTGRVSYTYLFGKEYSYSTDAPGGSGTHHGKYPGMNDIGLTAGARYNFNDNWFGGLEGGLCFDSGDGHSETGGLVSAEVGYGFWGELQHAIAVFFGLCGDPKIQIGIRYSIRL